MRVETKKNGRWYAVRTMQLPNGKRMTQHMARVIMGEPEGMEIDHIDRDATLINLESNLRIATHAQNTWNQRLRNSNTSGVVGVTWDKPRPANRMKSGRWRAQIDHNGKKIHLGLFQHCRRSRIRVQLGIESVAWPVRGSKRFVKGDSRATEGDSQSARSPCSLCA